MGLASSLLRYLVISDNLRVGGGGGGNINIISGAILRQVVFK